MKNWKHNRLKIYFKRKDRKSFTEKRQREGKKRSGKKQAFKKKAKERRARYEQFKKQKYNIVFSIAFPDKERQPATLQRTRWRPTYRFLKVAASLVGVILAGLGWFLSHDKGMDETATQTAATTTITPGSTKATLSLVDGQNRLLVPAGGEYSIELPDGTKVWLNAASAFRYPVAFGKAERVVELEEGEAYFEVAKKTPAQPFIVIVKGQRIQVLGTQFNVNAYKEAEAVATTLIEGSVRITHGTQRLKLKPGQQARLNKQEQHLDISTVNPKEVTAWKDNQFIFHHKQFSEIMADIQRWYDVEIVYLDTFQEEHFMIGALSRRIPLDQLLESLKAIRVARFQIEGRKVYISRYR